MPEYQEIVSKLCAIVQRHAETDQSVTEQTLLASDLGLDSARVMEVLLEVEEGFDVSVPLNVLPEVETVRDLALELERLLAESQ